MFCNVYFFINLTVFGLSRDPFLKVYFCFTCMCAHLFAYHRQAGSLRDQASVLHPLELELQVAVRHNVGVGNCVQERATCAPPAPSLRLHLYHDS